MTGAPSQARSIRRMSASQRRARLVMLRSFAALSAPARVATPHSLPLLRSRARILLIRPDHIGDLLFTTPALRALRQALPQAHLTCMVGPWGQAVLENLPNLDELVLCDFPGFGRRPKVSALAPYRELWRWAARLGAGCFDLALVLRFDHWWGALLAYLAGIPRRVGYDVAECKPFLTRAVPYMGQRHEVLQNLTLIQEALKSAGVVASPEACSGGRATEVITTSDEVVAPSVTPSGDGTTEVVTTRPLEYVIAARDDEHAAQYLHDHGVQAGQTLVAIHPGAGALVKLWRSEGWAEVADALACRWQARIVLTGGRDELDLAWSVYARTQCNPIVAAGQTSLGQLAALFRRCRLVLGPDCGPLHLAVAVGTPTVHLYGPVDARKFGPWGPADKHLVTTSGRDCIPCNRLDYGARELQQHPCVYEISVNAVLEAVARQMMPDSMSSPPNSRRWRGTPSIARSN